MAVVIPFSPVCDVLLLYVEERGERRDKIRSSGIQLLWDASIPFLDPCGGSLMAAMQLGELGDSGEAHSTALVLQQWVP